MSKGFGIDARASREVAAAVAAFRLADSGIKRAVRQDVAQKFNGEWGRMVRADAALPPHGGERARMLRNSGSVKVNAGNPPQLMAYQSGQLAKGVKSRDLYGAWEFGGRSKGKRRYVTRSPKGKRYIVNRATQNQMPPRQSEGYSVYPQVAQIAPKIVSYWVATVVFTYYDALDGAIT